MDDESELLRRFAETGDESAFEALVRRRVDFVYNVALRQVGGDVHLAQEVVQDVILDLARRARALARHPALVGWIYTATRFAAAKAVRGRDRRLNREEKAHAMNEILSADPAPALEWEQLRPVLDAAMHELGEVDRTAILLRYFENRRLADVGARLGLAEHAAGRRVERAIDKLRLALARRGIASTASALASTLVAQPVLPAPGTLAAAATRSALAGTGSAMATGLSAAAQLLLLMKTKSALSALAVVLIVGLGLYLGRGEPSADPRVAADRERQAVATLQAENARLEARLTDLQAAPVRASTAGMQPSSVTYDSDEARTAAILKNLTMLHSLASQFSLEKGRAPSGVDDLVGEGRYAKSLPTVDGEDYSRLNYMFGLDLEVTTSRGLTVTLKNTTAYGIDLNRALAAYRAAGGTESVPPPEVLAPFFGDSPEGVMRARSYAGYFDRARPAKAADGPDFMAAALKAQDSYRRVNDGARPASLAELRPYFETPALADAFIEHQRATAAAGTTP